MPGTPDLPAAARLPDVRFPFGSHGPSSEWRHLQQNRILQNMARSGSVGVSPAKPARDGPAAVLAQDGTGLESASHQNQGMALLHRKRSRKTAVRNENSTLLQATSLCGCREAVVFFVLFYGVSLPARQVENLRISAKSLLRPRGAISKQRLTHRVARSSIG
ncbi:hypothetical protein [Leisingera sp. ANG59]|uniref:hypothetical protein n=1 Tax=Leisingera sp. ANG59 TaxID=2675221 RepID=UPI0015723A7B|nr:hypothetical protein [Leisingera sp. ANG59]NSY40048.1 hypothetical protein [Leisingera sp. ANG59]